MKPQGIGQKSRAWIGVSFLILFAILYCLSALIAPFWSDNDTWSNLLPIIHYKHSIVGQHTLPLHTDLWYGGRAQWANPLWSFLYLPATVIWLISPLDWGTRIVFLGHLIFALLAGRKLASLFLDGEIEKVSAAVIFSSPIFPALTAGHVEKVMSWGWVLLAFWFLFNEKMPAKLRGLWGGVCLGIIPLTGANYYAFYAGIILLPLALTYKDRQLITRFFLGALIGLLHLPSVWYMIGEPRTYAKIYIEANSISPAGLISSLSIGFGKSTNWETWTPVGVLIIFLFGFILVKQTGTQFLNNKEALSLQDKAILVSIVLLSCLATGIAYRGHEFFDSFRVPSRALAFIALMISIFVFANVKYLIHNGMLKQSTLSLLIYISATQIAASAWTIRPAGSIHGPYETSVQNLADTLKADHANSVWFSAEDLGYMYIHAGLTRNDLALPAVYYGDMGQTIKITGDHCGYSFDHLIAFAPVEGSVLELNSDVEWSNTRGEIPVRNLLLLEQIKLDTDLFNVYRVICDG